MHQVPSSMLRHRLGWTLNNAWSGSCVCRCDAPCRAVWPPGRHESSVQSCSACRWTHNPAENSADNSLPFSSYTLFRVVNFRCADMRLLFFPVQTIKAVFRCNIIYRQLCHCPVSVYRRLVQVLSFASLVFGSAIMSCLLSCLLW